MNPNNPPELSARPFGRLLLPLLFLLGAHAAFAQVPVIERTLGKEVGAKVQLEAQQLAKAGNVVAAEKALTDRSKFKSGSTEWHRDAGQSVAKLAQDLAREGHRAAIPALAASALKHFADAGTPALSNKRKAALKISAARVHEELRGDYAAAIASYAAAVSLDPADRAAQEAHERLKAADATLRARIATKKKS